MRRRALLLSVVALSACGPESGGGKGLDISLFVQAGLLDAISGFQISVISQGQTLDCSTAQTTCIAGQVPASRFLTIHSSDGKSGHSVFFPLKLVAGTPNTQDLSITDVPPGKDYAVVVEALSKDTPALLAGSSCNYAPVVAVGSNPAVTAHVTTFSPAKSCATAIP
jgi:hypothetical protein